MSVQDAVREHREEILRIAAQHGATNVRVFGSVARGTAGPDSDLDLLVDVTDDAGPWFPVDLVVDLEDLLGVDVDVVTESTVHWVIRDRVIAEARPLSDGDRPQMTSVKDDRLFFVRLQECVFKIRRYTAGGRDAFLIDEMTQDAVVRNVQIVAEMLLRLSPACKAGYPALDSCHADRILRTVVHEIRRPDPVALWDLVEKYVEPIERAISTVLAGPNTSPESAD